MRLQNLVALMRNLIAGIVLFAAVATFLATGAHAQDELRVRQLENEVLRLQRELDDQSRRIEELERSLRTAGTPRTVIPSPTRTADSSPAWLVTSNWDRLRPGMKDLEVIAVLGRPNFCAHRR